MTTENTIKSIKVDPKNELEIETALAAANGKAQNSVYRCFSTIEKLAKKGEDFLENLGIAQCRRAGAAVVSQAGEPVGRSYKWGRFGLRVRLERRKAGWYLVSAQRDPLYSEGGKTEVHLSVDQDAEAVKNLRHTYKVENTMQALNKKEHCAL